MAAVIRLGIPIVTSFDFIVIDTISAFKANRLMSIVILNTIPLLIGRYCAVRKTAIELILVPVIAFFINKQ